MARAERVERPIRASEYEIRFATNSVKKGWKDLRAMIRGPLADTSDFLTRSPLLKMLTKYPLKDALCISSRCKPGIRTRRSNAG